MSPLHDRFLALLVGYLLFLGEVDTVGKSQSLHKELDHVVRQD